MAPPHPVRNRFGRVLTQRSPGPSLHGSDPVALKRRGGPPAAAPGELVALHGDLHSPGVGGLTAAHPCRGSAAVPKDRQVRTITAADRPGRYQCALTLDPAP